MARRRDSKQAVLARLGHAVALWWSERDLPALHHRVGLGAGVGVGGWPHSLGSLENLTSLFIHMTPPHLCPPLIPLFHPEILRGICLGITEFATYFHQLRFGPIFLEACK